jgi:hypothetical protein
MNYIHIYLCLRNFIRCRHVILQIIIKTNKLHFIPKLLYKAHSPYLLRPYLHKIYDIIPQKLVSNKNIKIIKLLHKHGLISHRINSVLKECVYKDCLEIFKILYSSANIDIIYNVNADAVIYGKLGFVQYICEFHYEKRIFAAAFTEIAAKHKQSAVLKYLVDCLDGKPKNLNRLVDIAASGGDVESLKFLLVGEFQWPSIFKKILESDSLTAFKFICRFFDKKNIKIPVSADMLETINYPAIFPPAVIIILKIENISAVGNAIAKKLRTSIGRSDLPMVQITCISLEKMLHRDSYIATISYMFELACGNSDTLIISHLFEILKSKNRIREICRNNSKPLRLAARRSVAETVLNYYINCGFIQEIFVKNLIVASHLANTGRTQLANKVLKLFDTKKK